MKYNFQIDSKTNTAPQVTPTTVKVKKSSNYVDDFKGAIQKLKPKGYKTNKTCRLGLCIKK